MYRSHFGSSHFGSRPERVSYLQCGEKGREHGQEAGSAPFVGCRISGSRETLVRGVAQRRGAVEEKGGGDRGSLRWCHQTRERTRILQS